MALHVQWSSNKTVICELTASAAATSSCGAAPLAFWRRLHPGIQLRTAPVSWSPTTLKLPAPHRSHSPPSSLCHHNKILQQIMRPSPRVFLQLHAPHRPQCGVSYPSKLPGQPPHAHCVVLSNDISLDPCTPQDIDLFYLCTCQEVTFQISPVGKKHLSESVGNSECEQMPVSATRLICT